MVLHSWDVGVEEAVRIQETLRQRVVLENTISELKSVGGGDVGYAKEGGPLVGVIVVLSFPEMELLDAASAHGEASFPYIPGLLSFREGPILIEAMNRLKIRPDVMIYEGQGIAYPRGFGLASHLGLWFDIPSIGGTKKPLLRSLASPARSRGSVEWIEREGEKVGAALRTREGIKPIFVSPGHRIDLATSIQIVLATCRGFRIPVPLRRAHHLTRQNLALPGRR